MAYTARCLRLALVVYACVRYTVYGIINTFNCLKLGKLYALDEIVRSGLAVKGRETSIGEKDPRTLYTSRAKLLPTQLSCLPLPAAEFVAWVTSQKHQLGRFTRIICEFHERSLWNISFLYVMGFPTHTVAYPSLRLSNFARFLSEARF